MADTVVAGARLRELRALGVRLAMDDFGTGYSSLSYLSSFPFSILKMDRSFMRDGGGDAHARSLAEAIVSLGRTLDLQVVAEGIEHREQLDAMRALGCELGQGFLFARPMNLADIGVWLATVRAAGGFAVGPPAGERSGGGLELEAA